MAANELSIEHNKTAYIFPSVMSSFLPEKEHMRESHLFCFNLKQHAEFGFVGSKMVNLTWGTRSVKIGP